MGNEGSKGSRGKKLFDAAFEMRQQSKMLEKESQKIMQKEAQEKQKIAQALKKNDLESAKIYAETAIRTRKEAINVQRFSAKMGAVAAKLDSAYRTQQISQQIKSCVPKLNSCLKHMNKLQISEQMMNFEKVFEDLDVKTADISGALESVTGSSVQQDENTTSAYQMALQHHGNIIALIMQLQQEQGLDVGGSLQSVGAGKLPQKQSNQQQQDVNDMQRQLDALKNL